MKFKILHVRSGIQYSPEYRGSLQGAVNVAASKGWFKTGDPEWSLAPNRAHIYVEVHGQLDRWEHVATVTAAGITSLTPGERTSIEYAQKQIARYQAEIKAAEELQKSFELLPVEVQ